MVIVWAEPAKYDLKDIYDHISKESTFYANKVVDTIIESTEPLEKHPEMGRIVPEINDPNMLCKEKKLLLRQKTIVCWCLERKKSLIYGRNSNDLW